MKTLFRAAGLSALILAGAAASATAQTPPEVADNMFRATTLNVSAQGETKVAPDMATISLGVQTQEPTAQAAIAANAEKMSRVVAALKKGGLADKDIQTSNLSLSPQYVYQENLPPRLTGYQASNQVTVTVHDLSRLGKIVDATVNAGADNVGGVSFGIDDPTEAENAARLEAVRKLRAKADLYAGAAGYRVSRLVTMSEGGGYSAPPPPMPMMAMRAESAKYDTSVSPGELNVQVSVSATYELSR
ncbi:MAG TPA: SIMPL domain-containing protein [Caulobacteraceae bacterium]